jgi:quinolinate synthase
MDTLKQKIKDLQKEKNAVILAHNYQIEDVQLIADYLGDSLDLSRRAADVKHDMIVFAGVKFMAETAKVLSPQKRVLLPRFDAGCPMADMITVDDLHYLKEQHPGAKVVTYVNSSVEIKAESDVCCTSANAVKVVRNVDGDKVIFIPDRNLGAYVQTKVPEKKIILFEGYCYVHNRIKREEIDEMKMQHPGAAVIVHPEVRMELIKIADEVLSTSQMLKYVARSDKVEFIVATEQGLLERMKREHPDKLFLPAHRPKICSNMKRTSLRDIFESLNDEKYEIILDKDVAEKAFSALDKMLQYI